jgi:hypothetical protein
MTFQLLAATQNSNNNFLNSGVGAASSAQSGSTLESILKTGWIPLTETLTYASATTITVATGATSRWDVGDKIKLTSNNIVLYVYIKSVANTLLTIDGNALTNYAFSNIYKSKSYNPSGFNLNPTIKTIGGLLANTTFSQAICWEDLAGNIHIELAYNYTAGTNNITSGITVGNISGLVTLPITQYSSRGLIELANYTFLDNNIRLGTDGHIDVFVQSGMAYCSGSVSITYPKGF